MKTLAIVLNTESGKVNFSSEKKSVKKEIKSAIETLVEDEEYTKNAARTALAMELLSSEDIDFDLDKVFNEEGDLCLVYSTEDDKDEIIEAIEDATEELSYDEDEDPEDNESEEDEENNLI